MTKSNPTFFNSQVRILKPREGISFTQCHLYIWEWNTFYYITYLYISIYLWPHNYSLKDDPVFFLVD